MSDAQPIPPLGSTPVLKDADNHLPDSVAMSIAYHAQHPEEIDGRLAKLDREWDAAQAAALAASGVSLLGILRASAGRRRWLIPVLGVQCLHLWHTLHGRSDAPSILTKLGLGPVFSGRRGRAR